MSSVRGALPYVPCPTLDQQYAQRTVGPTPFSSAKSLNADFERPSVALIRSGKARAAAGGGDKEEESVVGCKMSFPAGLRSYRVGTLNESRSLTNIFMPAAGSGGASSSSSHGSSAGVNSQPPLSTPTSLLQVPNAVWEAPPPMFLTVKDPLHAQEQLPRDTLHPLISSLQAGENAKAAAANPVCSYLANASRTGPPCEAHRQASAVESRSDQANNAVGSFAVGDDDEEAELVSSMHTRKSGKQVSYRGDLRTFDGRTFSALGGFHEPDRYATTVVETASAQPTTLTQMAAKALASALHDQPSHAIPANVMASVRQKPLPNSGPKGNNVNRFVYSGLNNPVNGVIPPPQAFRNLSTPAKEILLSRERDCRNRLSATLRAKYTVFQPPPCGNDDDMDVSQVPSSFVDSRARAELSRKKSEAEVFRASQHDDPEPLDDLSDTEVDPIAAVGDGSTLGVWLSAVRHCASRRTIPVDNIPMTTHPAHATVLTRKMKVLTPQLISMHTSMSLSTQPITRLGETGIAMGDAQSQMKPPSISSFLGGSGAASSNVTQYSDLDRTPPNAFGFDSERFVTLMSDKGEEIEELFIEGCTWLNARALSSIGRYCVNVKLLNLQDCFVLTDEILTPIVETCKRLTYLNISGCSEVSGVPLAALFRSCHELHTLCMSGLPLVDEDAELAFAQMHGVPQLSILDISYCTNITNAVLTYAAQYCRAITVLDMSGCTNLTDVAISSVGSSLTHLSQLRLRLCTQFTLHGLTRATVATRNLRYLDLGGLTQINPVILEEMLKGASRLRTLSISGCTQLDDTAVGFVTRYCRSLHTLNISSCNGVSMASCMELVHELTDLRWLIVSESSISNAEVVMLSALRESCKVVRNQLRPQPKPTLIAFVADEKKKKKGADPKGAKKKK